MTIFQTPEEIAARDAFGRSSDEFEDMTGPSLNDLIIGEAERRLGVRLPPSYLDLLRKRNGGYLREDVEFDGVDGFLTAIAGIGYENGIDSDEGIGGLAMHRNWGYPKDMVYLEGDGHTGFFLDYRRCGPEGEPSVTWLDSNGETLTFVPVAPDFAAFVRLVDGYERTSDERSKVV